MGGFLCSITKGNLFGSDTFIDTSEFRDFDIGGTDGLGDSSSLT